MKKISERNSIKIIDEIYLKIFAKKERKIDKRQADVFKKIPFCG